MAALPFLLFPEAAGVGLFIAASAGSGFLNYAATTALTGAPWSWSDAAKATLIGAALGPVVKFIGSRLPGPRAPVEEPPVGVEPSPTVGEDPATAPPEVGATDPEAAPPAEGAGTPKQITPLNPQTRFYVNSEGEALDANTYARNSGFRSGVRDKAWEGAVDEDTGLVKDPLTGNTMDPNEPWDMGHKPGMEYWKERDNAINNWLDGGDAASRKQFLDRMNNPSRYRPEIPSSNRGHAGEDDSNLFWE